MQTGRQEGRRRNRAEEGVPQAGRQVAPGKPAQRAQCGRAARGVRSAHSHSCAHPPPSHTRRTRTPTTRRKPARSSRCGLASGLWAAVGVCWHQCWPAERRACDAASSPCVAHLPARCARHCAAAVPPCRRSARPLTCSATRRSAKSSMPVSRDSRSGVGVGVGVHRAACAACKPAA